MIENITFVMYQANLSVIYAVVQNIIKKQQYFLKSRFEKYSITYLHHSIKMQSKYHVF